MKVLIFLGLFLSLLFTFPTYAKKPRLKAAAKPPQCSQKELKRKGCLLRWKELRAGISPEKIRFTWGAWTSIADFPGKEKATEWKDIRVEERQGRIFISLKIWQKIEKEVTLEELHWFLMEPHETKMILRLDQVVGKRKMEAIGVPAKIQDALQPTQIFLEGDKGPLRWKVGSESGEIAHGI